MRIYRLMVLDQIYFTMGGATVQCDIETKPPMKCQNVSVGLTKSQSFLYPVHQPEGVN